MRHSRVNGLESAVVACPTGQAPNLFEKAGPGHPSVSRSDAKFEFDRIIDNICNLPWCELSDLGLLRVALAYYYFSVQFRENLQIALCLHPDDEKLSHLYREECNTSNLSPWEGVASEGEPMDHDEFMRRLLALQPLGHVVALECAGRQYLERVRRIPDHIRAKSIASYEDGGLFRVFSAILSAPSWKGAGLLAFRHFLRKHIEFDSGETDGHGALSRHITVDDSIAPLWAAFYEILNCAMSGDTAPNDGTHQNNSYTGQVFRKPKLTALPERFAVERLTNSLRSRAADGHCDND